MPIDFREMRGEQDLAVYMACHQDLVDRLRNRPTAEIFKVHNIPKKGKRGGVREVWEVREQSAADAYKGLARRLYSHLSQRLDRFPHPASHAYTPGLSILSNASAHLKAPRVQKGDIRGFFRAIRATKVKEVLIASG